MAIFCLLLAKNVFFPSTYNINTRFDKPIFNSQLLFFIQHHRDSFLQLSNNGSSLEDTRYEAATTPLRTQILTHQPLSKKILVIVNESWGETNNSSHQQAILEPIYQQRGKLQWIKQGHFAVIGATVAGELRELCHKQPLTLDLSHAKKEEFNDCIPNQLKQLGYQTYSLHGAKSMMYERDSWYPKAGFQHLYFFDQLANVGICYAFEGRCDIEIPSYIERFFTTSQPTFVYWLTLNTHTPYDDKVYYKGLDCSALGIKIDSETCGNYRLQYQFFVALSKLIQNPYMRGVEVYVAGDHSPPIFNMRDNLFSFKGSDIAWLHFKIKDD